MAFLIGHALYRIHTSWETLRSQLSTHQVVTVRLPTTDGRAFTIRFLTKDKRPAQSGLPNEMLAGVMLLWFLLTAISVIFVAWDIRFTPESPVLKAGFVLLTCYTGPFGAFL